MFFDLIFVLIGVVLLTGGGELLIRGAMSAARRANVSPLLAGLVIVGFGTSAPELVVSIGAALQNQPDIAIGNVVGSNIGNILLILGVCALVRPLTVTPSALSRDGLVVVGASVLFVVLVAGSALNRLDAAVLLTGLVVYLVWAYRTESRHGGPVAEVHAAEADELKLVPLGVPTTVAALLGGLVLLIVGSQVLLTGAIGIAETAGIPEAVIGLTLVAVGTSLPEFAVSILAVMRRHTDVAVGNILGSNIFNLLGILGVSALLQPLPVAARVLVFDQWMMLGSSVLLLVFLYTGRVLSRLEGGILLALYSAYIIASFTIWG